MEKDNLKSRYGSLKLRNVSWKTIPPLLQVTIRRFQTTVLRFKITVPQFQMSGDRISLVICPRKAANSWNMGRGLTNVWRHRIKHKKEVPFWNASVPLNSTNRRCLLCMFLTSALSLRFSFTLLSLARHTSIVPFAGHARTKLFFSYSKSNFPMTTHVRWSVGWLVGRSVIISWRVRKLHFHDSIGALVIYTMIFSWLTALWFLATASLNKL